MEDRFRPYIAALVFFRQNNSVLLTRRFNTGWSDGTYSVPSGHIEENENVIEAAVRECEEEVGITIEPSDLKIAHVSYRKSDDGRTYVDFFLVCEKWAGEPRNCEPDKCDDVRWFPVDSLPENTTPIIRAALHNILQENPFSQTGWLVRS